MERRWLWTIFGSLASGAVLVVVLVIALVGIPSAPSSSAASPTPTHPASSPPPSSTPTAAPPTPESPARAEATCENIMDPGFTTEWLPARVEEPEPLFAEGIQCWWAADPTVGTDNVLLYGWAPATPEVWDALVAERSAETDADWFTEEDERGVYLTHKTDYWVQDDEGYGTTYLFTGDAILFAQTKAETKDVVGPPSA